MTDRATPPEVQEAPAPGRSAAWSPIGVFDSGVGGLTVVKALAGVLPRESVVYFGDTARVPYGPKSRETVRRYSIEAAEMLLARGVKMVVVACNTATAHAADLLARELPIPVIGVIGPGVEAAVSATRSGRIGVLGTAGTIASGVYDYQIRERLSGARVYAQPCPLFVPLAEEGYVDHPATRLVAEEYLRPVRELDVDVIILGCTHYPLLRPLIQDVVGPRVTLVDSGAETARHVRALLEQHELLRTDAAPPHHTFLASDSPLRFREVGRRFIGDLIGTVEQVPVEGHEHAA